MLMAFEINLHHLLFAIVHTSFSLHFTRFVAMLMLSLSFSLFFSHFAYIFLQLVFFSISAMAEYFKQMNRKHSVVVGTNEN